MPETTRPIAYKIYKGINGKQGCFQFSLALPYTSQKKNEGAVFIEAAPATGPNQYDWNNKIIFALGVTDIGMIITGFRQGSFKVYHDPDAQTERQGTRGKRFTMESGKTPGTFFLELNEKTGENTKTVKISLQAHEARIISNLLEAALPKILGW